MWVIYHHMLSFGFVALTTMALLLQFNKVPAGEIYRHYERSRTILVIGILTLAFTFFLHLTLNLRHLSSAMATAINITTNYFVVICYSFCVIPLINKFYYQKRVITNNAIKFTLMASAMWTAAFCEGTLQIVLQVLGIALFTIDVLVKALVFYKSFKRANQKMENYYSEFTDFFIQWMLRCSVLVGLLALFSPLFSFGELYMKCIYGTVATLLFGYVVSCFNNFLIDFRRVSISIDTDSDDKIAHPENNIVPSSEPIDTEMASLNPSTVALIKKNVDKWVEEKGYHKKSVTIEILAQQWGTNRSYVSIYINSTYSTTFRRWISSMRINDAKEMLTNKELTIQDVSDLVGYSSVQHFTRAFSALVGTTPMQWREQQ